MTMNSTKNNTFIVNGKEYTEFMGKRCAIHTFKYKTLKTFGEFKKTGKYECGIDAYNYILPDGATHFYSNFDANDYRKYIKNKYSNPPTTVYKSGIIKVCNRYKHNKNKMSYDNFHEFSESKINN